VLVENLLHACGRQTDRQTISFQFLPGLGGEENKYQASTRRGKCTNPSIIHYANSCPLGFDGQGCERLACPNNCNNAGTCQTVKNVGYAYGADTQTTMNQGGDGYGPLYANWDHSSTTMCVCDHGFTGPDCSYRICAKGDDPLTASQAPR